MWTVARCPGRQRRGPYIPPAPRLGIHTEPSLLYHPPNLRGTLLWPEGTVTYHLTELPDKSTHLWGLRPNPGPLARDCTLDRTFSHPRGPLSPVLGIFGAAEWLFHSGNHSEPGPQQ